MLNKWKIKPSCNFNHGIVLTNLLDNWPFVLQRQNDYASLFNTWILWCSCQSLHRVTRWHKLLYPWMTEYVYSSLHWPLVWPLLWYCFWHLVSTVCNKIKKHEIKFSEHKIGSMAAGKSSMNQIAVNQNICNRFRLSLQT